MRLVARALRVHHGCMVAPTRIAPLFRGAPANVLLPQRFAAVLAAESA